MQAVGWVVMNLARIGIRVAAMVGSTVSLPGAIALGATSIVAGAAAMRAGLQSLLRLPSNIGQTDQQRSLTTRSAIAPQKIIYGDTVVSGVISFVGATGDNNRDLYHVIALAGHEVDSIKDIYLDNTKILNADINGGNPAGGDVGGLGIFKVVDSTNVVRVMKHLGDQTAVDSMVSTAFGDDYDDTHIGYNVAYIATRFRLFEGSQKTWDKHTPNNIKAQVRGKAVYDPRLDTSAGANPSDTTYFAWTDNSTLCTIDYLRDATFGLGVSATRIDWASVVAAANVCDASVNVPGGTQKRFTCNGALFSTDTHKNNLDRLLSSMQGSLIYSNGKYFIETGYTAPSETITDDDLIGAVAVETSFTLSDRFNTVKGVYVSDAQSNEVVEFPEVTIASAVTRDNGNTLKREIKLPFSSDTFQCQRIAHKMVQLSGQQQTIVLPTNLKGLRVRCGDRVNITIEELGWENKIFRCIDWAFAAGPQIGVNLTLREDASTAYADMDSTAYTSIDGAGVINAGFPGVPAPSGLTANLIRGGIELNWINPKETAKFKEVALYTGEDGSDAWDDRIEIARGIFDFYFHDNHNIADPIDPGDTRYYWVRALADNSGDDDDETASTKFPNEDPSTVYATAGSDSVPDSGGVVTGDLTVTNDLTALNLYVTGEEHIIEVTKLEITDPLMLLAKDQTQPLLPDLGFIARRGDDPGGEDPLNVAWVWVEGQDTFAAIGSTSDGVGTSPINITQYEPVRIGAAYINTAVDASYKLKLSGNSYLDGTLNVTGLITGDVDGDVAGDVTGDLTGNADSATLASTVTVQDSTDTAAYVALFEDATGSLGAKTDAAITYNAGTGALTATSFSGSGSNLASVDAVTLDGIDSADFVQLAGTQTITGAKTFNATVDLNGNDIDNVGSINLLNAVGDTDSDTKIQFAGSNIMVFKAGGVTYQQINDGVGAVQMYKPLSLLPAVTFTNPATDLVNSINAGGFGLAHQGASDAYITSNIYYNTSGDWTAKYAGSYGAGYLKIMGGQFQWYGAGGTTVAGSAPPSNPTLLFSILTSGAATFSSSVTASSFSGSGASLTSVDAATLDGLDSTAFVKLAGTQTITGNKTFNDDVKAIFGTGGDGVEIYHDALNSYIKDSGTGALRIAGSQIIFRNAADSGHMLNAIDGAGVALYFDTSSKLETVTGGVDVTGTLTATSFSGDGSALTNVPTPSNMVTTDTTQSISGAKTFSALVVASLGVNITGSALYMGGTNVLNQARELQSIHTALIGGAGIATSASLVVSGTGIQINDGTAGTSPKLVFGTEPHSNLNVKAIFLDSYWMTYQGHENEGHVFHFTDSAENIEIGLKMSGNNFSTPSVASFYPAGGRVGIGVDNPAALLHLVDGAGTLPGLGGGANFIIQNNDTTSDVARLNVIGGAAGYSTLHFGDAAAYNVGGVIYNHNTDTMTLDTGGTTALTASAGKVNIGGSTMSQLLNIQTASSSVAPLIEFRNTQAGSQIGMPANVNALAFYTADTERMRITSTGNQEFKGHASWNSDGGTSGIFMHYNSTTSHRGYFDWRRLQLGNNGANNLIAGNTSAGGYWRFWVNATGISQTGDMTNAGTHAVTIEADGDVDIEVGKLLIGGTEVISASRVGSFTSLNLTGNFEAPDITATDNLIASAGLRVVAASNAEAITVWGRSSDNIGQITLTDNDGGVTYAQIQSLSSELKLKTIANIPLSLHTNNTPRLTIASDGRVTIAGKATFGTPVGNALVEVKGSVAGDWAGRFENTSATGYGALVITASNSPSQNAFEVRNNTSNTAFRVYGNGNATFSHSVNLVGGALQMNATEVISASRVASLTGVLINTADAGYPAWGDDLTIGAVSGNNGMTIRSATDGYGTFYFSDATGTAAGTYAGKFQYNHNNDDLVLTVASGASYTTGLTITSTGVGIGTGSPGSYYSKNLVVMTDGDGTGGITLLSPATDDNAYLCFADGTGAAAYAGYLGYSHSSDYMFFGAASGTRMYLDDTGLGISTNDPKNLLHVYAGASGLSSYDARYKAVIEGNGEAYLSIAVPDTSYSGIRFMRPSGLRAYIDAYMSDGALVYWAPNNHKFTGANLTIHTGRLIMGSTEVISDSRAASFTTGAFTGNVGIGTARGGTTPLASLHVAGENNGYDGTIRVGERLWLAHRDAGTTKSWIASTYDNDATSFDIRLKGYADSDAKLTVLGNGNVEIPSGSLKVSLPGGYPELIIDKEDAQYGQLEFRIGATRYGFMQLNPSEQLEFGTDSTGGNVYLYSDGDIALTADTSQNVNINSGVLKMGGTEVISAARVGSFSSLNLTGNFSAPDITATDNLTAEGQVFAADGTAAAPGYSWTNDVDTGFFREDTNTIGMVTAGTERVRLKSDGALVLGDVDATITYSTNYGYEFHVQGTTGSQTYIAITAPGQSSGDEGIVIGTDADSGRFTVRDAKRFVLSTSNQDYFYMDATGHVSIGYSQALDGSRLYVSGNIQVDSGSSIVQRNGGAGQTQNLAKIDGVKNQYGSTSTNWDSSLSLYTHGYERLHINDSGNAGVGVAAVAEMGGKFNIGERSGGTADLNIGIDNNNRSMFTYNGGTFTIGTRVSSTNYFDTLTIQNGNVGIGVTDPGAKLTVTGPASSVNLGGGSLGSAALYVNADASHSGELVQILDKNNVQAVHVSNGGNMGLGNRIAPAATLEVGGSGIQINNGTGGTTPKLVFGTEAYSNAAQKSIFMESYWMKIQGHRNEGVIMHGVNSGGTVQEFLRLTGDANADASEAWFYSGGSGKVAINGSTPATALDVKGTIRATRVSNAAQYGEMNGDGNLHLVSATGLDIVLKPADAESLRISQAGGHATFSGTDGMDYHANMTLINSADDAVGILFSNKASSPAVLSRKWVIGSGLLDAGDFCFRRSSTNADAPDTTTLIQMHNGNLLYDAYLVGAWRVLGTLSKTSGSFRIPHPLPELTETKDLVHSFTESPRAELIYRDMVVLAGGLAKVNIDEQVGMSEGTFCALTQTAQAFTSNESTWDLVRGSVEGNILTIESNNPDSTAVVSWMVIAERADAHMLDPTTTMTDDEGHVILEPDRLEDEKKLIEENENA